MAQANRNRVGSLPELWHDPQEYCLDFQVQRLNMKIENLELQVQNLSRQLLAMNRNVDRIHENEFSQNLIREITLPYFSGDPCEDAGEYIIDIERYITVKRIPFDLQPKVIIKSLDKRARIWFQAVRSRMSNFGDFIIYFRQEYMSDEIQDRAKEKWKAEKYRTGNLVEYFYLRVGEANRFYPPYNEYQRNRIIIEQLPQEIQIAMIGINLANSEEVTRALYRADEARARNLARYSERENKQTYQSDSRPYNSHSNVRNQNTWAGETNSRTNDNNRNFNRNSAPRSFENRNNLNSYQRGKFDQNKNASQNRERRVNSSAVLESIDVENEPQEFALTSEIYENTNEMAVSENDQAAQNQ